MLIHYFNSNVKYFYFLLFIQEVTQVTSRLNQNKLIGCKYPLCVVTLTYLLTSHIFIVLSSQKETINLASGLNLTLLTKLLCPK